MSFWRPDELLSSLGALGVRDKARHLIKGVREDARESAVSFSSATKSIANSCLYESGSSAWVAHLSVLQNPFLVSLLDALPDRHMSQSILDGILREFRESATTMPVSKHFQIYSIQVGRSNLLLF